MKKNYYETTETPQVDMHSVWVSLAIGVIAFIAAMCISNRAQAQPDSAAPYLTIAKNPYLIATVKPTSTMVVFSAGSNKKSLSIDFSTDTLKMEYDNVDSAAVAFLDFFETFASTRVARYKKRIDSLTTISKQMIFTQGGHITVGTYDTIPGNGVDWSVVTSYPTHIDPQQKKDTVEVQAACIEFIHVEAWEPSKASPVKWLQVLEVKTLIQEQTLEWQTWDSNTTTYAVYRPKSDWVTIGTRWLSPIDGCYQLKPLTND